MYVEVTFSDHRVLTLSGMLGNADAGSLSKGWTGLLGQWSGLMGGKRGVSAKTGHHHM